MIYDPILGPIVAQPPGRTLTRAAQARDLTGATNATMTLSVIDATQLPNLVIVGQTTFSASNLPSGNLQPLWPQPGTLAWVGSLQQNWFWPLLGASQAGGALMVYPGSWFWHSSGIQLWTFDVSRPSAPVLDSTFAVATNGWSDGGVATATNGLIYLSHSVWNFGPIPGLQTLGTNLPATLVAGTGAPVSVNPTNSLSTWTLTDQAAFQQLGGATLAVPISTLPIFNTLLGVQVGNGISLFNAAQPAALQSLGSGNLTGCLWPSLTGADGNVSAGRWSPLGDYGVFFLGVGP